MGGTNASTLFNIQHIPTSNNVTKRDEQFNEQDFTSGGIEAGFNYNQERDGGYLSTANDYGQMDHEVSCNFNGLGYNGLEFQLYDNNHGDTIAAGNIRACQSGAFDTNELTDITNLPLPINRNCAVA